MKNSELLKKSAADILRAALIALLVSLVGVLVFALIVRWASLDGSALAVGNYVIKAVSVLVGVSLGFRVKSSGAIKGGITGVLYMLLCIFVFAAADGFKSAGFNVVDFVTTVAAGIIAGVIAVNIPARSRR